ncbi:Uncharacterized conserved protein, DUF1800 family [Sphingomonas palmae]|uniref:Uncharacterized conserved protein, DUF1800 family n=1 Tax=Sphingomonas palmae TaxID=1855283 RepID=A0A1H7MKX8_9SPHN|nr:DUF1800 domain-containing protein [Sphingomonas palmae]SEL11814.1 Uncharacterized conserved protein, DUF1800 family [Sphingomonas palmae]
MPVAAAKLSPAAIALNRFGLGARPDDAPPTDPARWVSQQFDRFDVRPARYAALLDAGELVAQYRAQQQATRMARAALSPGATQPGDAKAMLKAARQDYRQDVQALYNEGVRARADAALATEAPFVERMVHFWSNHFCVSADNAPITAFAAAFERDAIRPHVLGRFSDMLLAVEQHPAMLIYLNQAQSIGPGSPAALRNAARNPLRKRGLNENLGREIMELHTLGVRSGYTQADVTEFARALTGWSVEGMGGGAGGDPNRFAFRANQHEPGSRTILGKRYDEGGEGQARAILADFACSPATATHVATKLARHFAGDDPPPAMVARLAQSFTASGGDLPTLYRALIASPEAWVPAPTKFKTPWEWTISALRGTGRRDVGAMQIAALQTQLGQRVWKPGTPAGWDDVAASWAASNALLRRVEVAQRLAAPLGQALDARIVALRIMPASLAANTADQIAHSESPAGAIALMLVSPDFLRR